MLFRSDKFVERVAVENCRSHTYEYEEDRRKHHDIIHGFLIPPAHVLAIAFDSKVEPTKYAAAAAIVMG